MRGTSKPLIRLVRVTRDPSHRRVRRALVVAPLAAPAAVWAGSVLHGLIGTRPLIAGHGVDTVVSAVVLGALVVAYGAPLSYVATAAVVWPLFRAIDGHGHAAWILAATGALAGGVLMPIYLHALAPRGTFDFFPGVGFVAGAASAWCFWRLATTTRRR